ncbi:MAG: hypothetical protein ACSHX7_10210 [Luteolibacter sp.]
MKNRPEIESLTSEVARRYDGFLRRRVVLCGVISVASVVILLSLFWLLRGHGVPVLVPVLAVVAGVIGCGVFVFLKRMSAERAAVRADEFFALKDGIATARHLAEAAPDDVATEFQRKWLEPKLGECDPTKISEKFPKRSAIVAGVLAVVAIVLCLLPASPAVAAAEKEAAEVRQRVAESKEELEKLIEELEKDIVAPEERENLPMDELRKMVKKLDENGDRAEAARQFARIDRKIREATRALDQQRDEETLKLAANELAKAEDTDARKLGKKLDAKELKEAAEMLEKMAKKKIDPKDLKNPDKKKQAIKEAKEELAKMRAASKRMAAAGKQRQAGRAAGGGGGASGGGEGQMGGDGGGAQGKELEDLLVELDEAAAEMEGNLEEMEFDPDAEWSDEAGENMARMKGQLGKRMKNMHGKRMAKSKLDQLRAGLSQAQAYTQGQTQMMGPPGGQKPGTGSNFAERKERDNSQENGALAELKGQHGDGPSLSAVEESESGTGVSGRRGEVKEREFTRQAEAFVQRDDVPEALKLGVRNYFENLQSATQE